MLLLGPVCFCTAQVAERVRIEHTSTRKRADNGFEDREGHQAPITLPECETLKIEKLGL